MITNFKGKTAVLTGAGSGFGLECARIGAKLGMKLVLIDVQADALDKASAEMKAAGAEVLSFQLDVSDADQMQAMSAAAKDPAWQGHIVNTASMAGLLNPPNMGVYNVSKHAVVSLSETLYQDLRLVSDQLGASVLCPYFVPTGISQSHRNRPAELSTEKPTRSQLIGQAMTDKAVGSGKVTAAEVAQKVFDAMAADQFYIYSHPKALGNVQARMEAIVQQKNPIDPFAERPEIGLELQAALRSH